ncbi:hypothetical protein EYF80_017460 [Liparis tanakae]|uniref:Uncharacterized protein n=1 Tax=Liparis tanakae TaxID=230148 RepID=A0A4Z2I2Z6_9TELE|nr:hypothetical protein EYF80_017460 [Liparis tanakae]
MAVIAMFLEVDASSKDREGKRRLQNQKQTKTSLNEALLTRLTPCERQTPQQRHLAHLLSRSRASSFATEASLHSLKALDTVFALREKTCFESEVSSYRAAINRRLPGKQRGETREHETRDKLGLENQEVLGIPVRLSALPSLDGRQLLQTVLKSTAIVV